MTRQLVPLTGDSIKELGGAAPKRLVPWLVPRLDFLGEVSRERDNRTELAAGAAAEAAGAAAGAAGAAEAAACAPDPRSAGSSGSSGSCRLILLPS